MPQFPRIRHARHRKFKGADRGSEGIKRLEQLDNFLVNRTADVADGGIGDTAAAKTFTATADPAVKATGTLTVSGAITPGSHAESVVTSNATEVTDGDTLTIGTTVYRFKDTPAQAYDVKRTGTAATTLDNLKLAINASGVGDGTDYFAGTLAHPTVVATTNTDTTQKVVARVPGTAANTAATTTTATTLSWADTTLGGGTGASNPGVAAETVTIGSVTYSFVDVLSETNAPAAAIVNQVLHGGTTAIALDNLKVAINAGATAGTNYSTGTVAHPTTNATTNTDTTQVIEADTAGAAGNAIATTETMANGAFGATTLEGGEDEGSGTLTATTHGFSTGDGPFLASSTTTLPAGLVADTQYWVRREDADTLTVYLSRREAGLGLNAVHVTDAGTGTHSLTLGADRDALLDHLRQGVSSKEILGLTDIDDVLAHQ